MVTYIDVELTGFNGGTGVGNRPSKHRLQALQQWWCGV